MEFLNNSWVVGVGGGIISSLIVYFVTRRIFSKKENKEYLQKLRTANNELIYAVRPFLVERKIPNADVIDSIVLATAMKYEVNEYDVYYYEELADHLIKEITENSFLSAEDKIEFCELANKLKKYAEEQEKQEEQELKELRRHESAKKSNNTTVFSLTLAIMTMTFSVVTIIATDLANIDLDTSKFSTILLVSTIVPVMAVTISLMLQIMRRAEKRRNLSEEKEKPIPTEKQANKY